MDGVERQQEINGSLRWVVAGSTFAAAVGLLVGANSQIAVGLLVAAAVVTTIAFRPQALLVVLVLTIIFEALTFGGLTISRIVAPLALVVVLVQFLRGRTTTPPAVVPVFFAAAYALWGLASGFWTLNEQGTTFAVQSCAIALVYSASFALLIRDRSTVRLIMWTFAIGTLLVGFFSLGQLSGRLTLFPSTVLEERAQGGVGNANIFAAVQLVALPLTIALYGSTRSLLGRLVLLATILVIPASVLGSLSRGGSIGLAVTLVVFLLAPGGTFLPRRQKWIVAAALLFAAVLLLSRPTFGRNVTDRIGLTHPQFTVPVQTGTSGSGRTDIWITAWGEYKRHPFLGIGWGAFKPLSNDLFFDTPGFKPDEKVIRSDGAEVHNTYLATLTELGPVGLALFLGLLVSTGVELRRIARRSFALGDVYLGRIANAMLLSLVVWQLTGIFGEWETARPGWILIGMTLALSTLVSRTTSRSSGVRG